jgi:pyroglutamyl-peptidase
VRNLLPDLLQRMDPDAVLLIGLAGRSRMLRIETRAANRASVLHADAARYRPNASKLEPAAPAFRKVQTPIAALVAAARRNGVAARPSIDAGTYICNATLFTCLGHAAAAGRPHSVVFVHIPRPRPARRSDRRSARPRPSDAALLRGFQAITRALMTSGHGR